MISTQAPVSILNTGPLADESDQLPALAGIAAASKKSTIAQRSVARRKTPIVSVGSLGTGTLSINFSYTIRPIVCA
jgi:hypothetical protein